MNFLPSLAMVIAIAWSGFQLYTAYAGFLLVMVMLPIHLSFALALSLCLFPMFKGCVREKTSIVDLGLVALSISTGVYILLNEERITGRTAFVDRVWPLDILFGLILVALLLEVSRRTMRISLTVITFVFLAYGFLGTYISGILGHGGMMGNCRGTDSRGTKTDCSGRIPDHIYVSRRSDIGLDSCRCFWPRTSGSPHSL